MKTDDFIEYVASTDHPELLWSAVCVWLDSRGFDRVIHLSIGDRAPVALRSTLGDDFGRYYRDRQLARHDPFLSYCVSASQPIATGVEYLSDYEHLTKEETAVIHAAADAGFRSGFSCITRRTGSGCEAWNIGSSLGRTEVEKIRQSHGDELRLGLLSLRNRLAEPLSACLSVRESQCLRLLADGLRTKAIANELGIASVTVELHVKNARVKLGVATREQAVAVFSRSFV